MQASHENVIPSLALFCRKYVFHVTFSILFAKLQFFLETAKSFIIRCRYFSQLENNPYLCTKENGNVNFNWNH